MDYDDTGWPFRIGDLISSSASPSLGLILRINDWDEHKVLMLDGSIRWMYSSEMILMNRIDEGTSHD